MEAKVYNQEGKETGKVTLAESVFGLPWNADLVHQVVTSMQSDARTPYAHTKDRGEVRGGGKKPWQQKGTGRARHGSSRSPIWVGGGVTHGPRNEKNYSRKVNKKMKAKALFTILSQKHRDNEVLFVDALTLGKPKTADAKKILSSIGGIKGFEALKNRRNNAALIALSSKNSDIEKSFDNFSNIEISELRNINPMSVLNYKYLVIESPKTSLEAFSAKIS